MKKLILLTFILLPWVVFSQETNQAEKLKMMVGTWRTDLSTFKSTIPGFTSLPDHKVVCKEVTDGSINCKYFMIDANGNLILSQSELFAYDQATNKVYNMTFEGPNVRFGYLSFDGNLMNWTQTDVDGNVIQGGTMLVKPQEMNINSKMADGSGTVSYTYKREE